MRLGDIASALGFETSAIDHWINNSPRRDDGTVIVQKKLVVLHSEVHFGRNSAGNELDRASTICSVTISLKKYVPPKPAVYLHSDSNPRVRVKSVTRPKDRTGPITLVFEIAADGKTPLGLEETQVEMRIVRGESILYRGARKARR